MTTIPATAAPAARPRAAHRRRGAAEAEPPGTEARATGGVAQGLVGWLEHLALALLAFVPLLVVHPGVVTSDTKTYLYLDPGRFLGQVAWMWNPTVALGTVTHEYIGYLLPMGPFYAVAAAAHVPLWVAQRLWLGGILFAAGAGILYLCRVLSVRGPGRVVAALAFMLSPYFLQYAGRISVILLPWAGLPWMVAFAVLALRRGGWRYPALFALVVAVVSGINASSIIYVGVAPVLWLLYAVAVERDGTWGQAAAAAGRIAVLTALSCLWWIVGLGIEAAYGVNVLKYTETVPSTSETSSATEIIRGLGYWYFYGGDRLGPWTRSAVLYTQQLWLLALSYLVPVLAFLAAVFTRWRHRAYFVLLVVVGVVLSVGAHPIDHPTPAGGVLKAFMTDTTAGLAMRSTDRATPLVVLGLAMLLGAGVTALWARRPWIGAVTAVVVAGLVVANNPAVFNGDAEVASTFRQPAALPAYQMAAIDHLNATHPGTRVLAIPGDDFATDRWGNTVDTPQPAYLTRPFVTREQQVMGSMPTADILYAMDEPIQTSIENWNALAPMARLMSAGDVMVEYDQAYEHYGVPHPQLLALALGQAPAGLSDPRSFGTPVPNISSISTLDEQDLAAPAAITWPSPLVTYTVDTPRPITRAESNRGAVVVAGDATGIQALAGTGLLDGDSAIYYAGTLTDGGGKGTGADSGGKAEAAAGTGTSGGAAASTQLRQLLRTGAVLAVTDTNRKQAFRWDTLTANYGYTETPSEDPAKTTLSDSPIDLFPKAAAGAHTTAAYVGAVDVTASSYGNPVSYTPENRAYSAVDGNLDTAWVTGTFVADPAGQWWQARFSRPATTDHVTLVQPQTGTRRRWITRATLTFDGGHPLTVSLGPSSRNPTGQTVHFPARTFHTLRVTIDATNDDTATPAAASAVGFAEVQVPGVQVVEVVKMPTDLLDAAGASSVDNRLTLSMTRQRITPFPPRSDPEANISRQFTLPTARTFTLSGTASISALIPDDQIDRLVGLSGSTGSGTIAYSSARLPGSLWSGAAAAVDGRATTAWQPGFGTTHQVGDWLQYNLARPLTFDHMDLQVVADGRHSVPTQITVTATTAAQLHPTSYTRTLPAITDSATPGATTTVPVTFPALTGQRITVTVTRARLEKTTNYYAQSPLALPLGIAELGIPGLDVPAFPATVPGTCQSNLLSIDGHPVTVQVVGSTAAALANGELAVEPCGADASGIVLSAGPHVVQTQVAHQAASTTPTAKDQTTVHCQADADCSGWNIDQLTLDSAAGGGPEPRTTARDGVATGSTTPGAVGPSTPPAAVAPPATGPVPTVTVADQDPTAEQARVSGVTAPFELVLGQSDNAGWQAVAHPAAGAPAGAHDVDLGAPQLVDGFANGWPVTQADLAALGVADRSGTASAATTGGGGGFTVTLTWTPQRTVWVALGISGVALLFCLLVAVLPARWRRVLTPRRRRKRRPGGDHSGGAEAAGTAATAAVGMAPETAAETDMAATPPTAAGQPDGPRLGLPFAVRGRRPPWWAVAIVAVVTGAVAAAISAPLIGLAAGVAVAVGLLVPQVRAVTAVVAVGLLVAAAASVVADQALHPLPESSNWASAYDSQAVLVWMAVVFLGADAVIDTARTMARRRPRGRRRGRRRPMAKSSAPEPDPAG
ncbi:MAG TPA: alpha-(1-_3)-arabinofuranosyltransferase family protein [Acidimicrobiales bacterium]|nr:alpha-(1->3)-arabinofuranosyltransferase family protein [Acidimicrobiales bacterium]